MRTNIILSLLVFLMGCKQESIVTYQVPKEFKPLLMNDQPTATPSTHNEIEWKLPPGWFEQAPSSMRVGSFLVHGKNGQSADISIVPLAGDAGGDLANINRWRGQINLAPIQESDLATKSQMIKAGERTMRLVDFVSDTPLIDNKFKKRLVAAIYFKNGRSWFFKMMGEDSTVTETKPAFLKFLADLKIHDHE